MARLSQPELALTYWYELQQLSVIPEEAHNEKDKKRIAHMRKVIKRETLKAMVKQSNGKCSFCGSSDAAYCYERHMRGRSCG